MQYNETMALSGWYAALLVGLAACSPYGGGGAFHCDRDDQCTGGGTCEPLGLCSFADGECASGRRYGDSSGGLSRVCVGDEPVDGAIDAPPGDADPDASLIDAPIDAPPVPFCDTTNAALAGCWEFENSTNDASGHNFNATATNASFGQGKVGMGLTLQANSLCAVADVAALSPPMVTMEAFIRPTTLPTGGARMGVMDNNNSYGLFLVNNAVSCSVNVTVTGPVVAANQWTHIACTFDGTTGRLYINGAQVGMTAGGSPLGNGDASGLVIGGNSPNGDQLIGTIDQVRVWNVARTPQQVCAASGAPLCP